MQRLVLFALLALHATGCLLPHGSGYSHSSSGVKSPFLEILYWNDEPAVVLLVDGNAGLEVTFNENDVTGLFTIGEDQAILWYYVPSDHKSKNGTLRLCQGNVKDPDRTGWPTQYRFDTAKGNVIMIRLEGKECSARQTSIDEKKLKAIAKEHRTGIGAPDITLEGEKAWKIAAAHTDMTDFLQDSRYGFLANGTSMQSHVLRGNAAVQSQFEVYRQKESAFRRGVHFYGLAAAINNARERTAITQGEVISYLGEPDDVAEYTVLDKPGEAAYSRLVYTYGLRQGNVKGNIVAVEFEKGRFTKYDYYPDTSTK